MRDQIVLPKFSVPRGGTYWAMRALWIVGGLVLTQSVVLGIAVWKHQSPGRPTAASVAPASPTVATRPVSTARPAAALPLPLATRPVAAEAQQAPARAHALSSGKVASSRPARASHGRSRHASRATRSGKMLAKASASSAVSHHATKPKKPDAIDDLLAKFK